MQASACVAEVRCLTGTRDCVQWERKKSEGAEKKKKKKKKKRRAVSSEDDDGAGSPEPEPEEEEEEEAVLGRTVSGDLAALSKTEKSPR